MGCCIGGRNLEKTNFDSKDKDLSLRPKNYRSFQKNTFHMTKNYISNTKFISNSISFDHPDFFLVKNAMNTNDIPILISNLESEKKVKEIDIIKHPWVETPKTIGYIDKITNIGSVATIYLASFFVKEGKYEEISEKSFEETVKNNTRRIEKSLNKNLISHMNDRRELTIILILYLVYENKIMQDYILKTNVFQKVIELTNPIFELTSQPNKIELRLAALEICSDIYSKRKGVCELFCATNGINNLKELLKHDNPEIVAAAFTNLHELYIIEEYDENQNVIEVVNKKILFRLTELGFIETLENVIKKFEDYDLPDFKRNEIDDIKKEIYEDAKFLVKQMKKYK